MAHTSKETGNRLNCTAMQMLGVDLEHRFKACGRKFSLRTILFIAKQLFEQFEIIHDFRVMHRDLKPDNIMTGLNEDH